MTSHVTLRHPKTNGEWSCPAAAVDGWLLKGWKRLAPAETTDVAAAPVPNTVEALSAPKLAKEK